MRLTKVESVGYMFKKFLKSKFTSKVIGKVLYWYLKLVKATSRIEYDYENGFSKEKFESSSNIVFIYWHQELATSVLAFEQIGYKINALISPHSDGQIISKVVENIGVKTISGSTNKSAISAIKLIMGALRLGENVVVTPDGPKGPAREINSNIMNIAAKTSSTIVPVSINISRKIEFNSWDKFHFPLPFSKIKVKFAKPIIPTSDKDKDDKALKSSLNRISQSQDSYKLTRSEKLFEALLTVASIIMFPFQTLLLILRLIRRKESLERVLERFSVASEDRTDDMIWIHAASVGESIVAFSLIDMLIKHKKDLKFLVTTGTLTSANLVASKMEQYNHYSSEQIIVHQFLPMDNIFITSSFINYWRPKLALFIESELWPCILYSASSFCPVILVNARMSPRSFSRWKWFKFIINNIGGCFTHTLVQSNQDKKHFKAFNFNNTELIGNLKYVQKDDNIDIETYSKITQQVENRKIIFAASTHPGEEEIIIDAYLTLKSKIKDLLLIIAPRHPSRTNEIIEILKSKNLKSVRRTESKTINSKTSVFILDTIGEMALIFKLKPITFMGGSFTIGGHNILEPAKYDSPIIYGPDMINFQEISDEFLKNKAAIQVKNKQELVEELESMIKSSNKNLSEYTEAAANIIKSKQLVGKDYIERLSEYL